MYIYYLSPRQYQPSWPKITYKSSIYSRIATWPGHSPCPRRVTAVPFTLSFLSASCQFPLLLANWQCSSISLSSAQPASQSRNPNSNDHSSSTRTVPRWRWSRRYHRTVPIQSVPESRSTVRWWWNRSISHLLSINPASWWATNPSSHRVWKLSSCRVG